MKSLPGHTRIPVLLLLGFIAVGLPCFTRPHGGRPRRGRLGRLLQRVRLHRRARLVVARLPPARGLRRAASAGPGSRSGSGSAAGPPATSTGAPPRFLTSTRPPPTTSISPAIRRSTPASCCSSAPACSASARACGSTARSAPRRRSARDDAAAPGPHRPRSADHDRDGGRHRLPDRRHPAALVRRRRDRDRRRTAGRRDGLLIAGGLIGSGIADGAYLYQNATSGYVEGTFLDTLWMIAAGLIALAAWRGAGRAAWSPRRTSTARCSSPRCSRSSRSRFRSTT